MSRVMQRALLWVVLAVALLLTVRYLYVALASEETRIRWRLDEMIDGFNERTLRDVLVGFAPEFRDPTSGVTRDQLEQLLRYLFLSEVGRDGAFALRAELSEDDLMIEVADDGKQAKVRLLVRFFARRGEEEQAFWDARIAGGLSKSERGWQWVRVDEINHADRRHY